MKKEHLHLFFKDGGEKKGWRLSALRYRWQFQVAVKSQLLSGETFGPLKYFVEDNVRLSSCLRSRGTAWGQLTLQPV